MNKDNVIRVILLTILCLWPILVILYKDAKPEILGYSYAAWIVGLALFFYVEFVPKKKDVAHANKSITTICNRTLENVGFRYNVQEERWQIGCIGAPCFVFYNPASSNVMPNMMGCSNFDASGNDEHFTRRVYCIEDILLVLNACGITEDMIKKAQEIWR